MDGAGDAGGAGGASSASDGGAGGTCSDSCFLSDPTTCSDGVLSYCTDLFAECASVMSSSCTAGFCADEQSCGTCPQQCTKDATGCAKGAMRTCQTDARGCLVWGEAESTCASGVCADDGQTCGVCSNECPTAGATECENDQVRSCYEDAYGCRSWWYWSDCVLGACGDATHCTPGFSQTERGTPLDDAPRALVIDHFGAIVTVGGYHRYDLNLGDHTPEFDAHLYSRSASGSLQLFESWGSVTEADEAVAIAVTSDNSYVVVGYTDGTLAQVPSHGGRDPFLSKWIPGQSNEAPVLEFSRQWGSTEDEQAVSVALDRDDTAYVLGDDGGDVFLTRWDSAGNFLGTQQFGTTALDRAASVVVDSQDNVIIAGSTEGAWPTRTNAGQGDAFVLRLDSDGSAAMTTQWGSVGDEQVAQMIRGRDGDMLVLGTTDGVVAGSASAGGRDVFLSKVDRTGEVLFSQQWGTTADDVAAALAQAPTGEIFAAITVNDAEQGCVPGQALLLKWDEDGTNPDPRLFDTCDEDRATALTVDPNGTVYLAGLTYGSFVNATNSGGSDIFMIMSQNLY